MRVVASEMSLFEPVIAFTTLLARAALCVQDQAVMEINLGAHRLSAELAMAKSTKYQRCCRRRHAQENSGLILCRKRGSRAATADHVNPR
jgi:hypothetical protein